MDTSRQFNHCNPLLIPLVLNEVFQHLPYKDLKTSRAVCKVWRTEALKRMSLHEVFKYLLLEDLKECRLVCKRWSYAALEAMSKNSVLKIDSYEKANEHLESFQPGREFIFQGYQLKTQFHLNHEIIQQVDLNHESIQEIFDVRSQYISHLDLQRVKWSFASLRKVLLEKLPNLTHFTMVSDSLPRSRRVNPKFNRFDISRADRLQPVFDLRRTAQPKLPKLKYLRLDMNIVYDSGFPRRRAETFLYDFLHCVPNLEYFWWDGNENHLAGRFAVHFILKTPTIQWPKLTTFRANGNEAYFRAKKMKLMQDKNWPLTKIRVRIEESTITVGLLHEFILSFKTTIKYLGLGFLHEGTLSPAANSFPRTTSKIFGERIEGVELWGYNGTFNFLQDFPNLKALLLWEIDLNVFTDTVGNTEVFKCLTKVVVNNCQGQFPNRLFTHLPSLKIHNISNDL